MAPSRRAVALEQDSRANGALAFFARAHLQANFEAASRWRRRAFGASGWGSKATSSGLALPPAMRPGLAPH